MRGGGTNVNGCVFASLGGKRRRKGVTVALGLSILSCLGCNSECLDMCGRPCVNSDSQAALREDLLRRSWSLEHWTFLILSLSADRKGHGGAAAAAATNTQQL